ncbi:MAG: hypothetical protein ACKV22_02670 [Bryobacteraceae bacterium]
MGSSGGGDHGADGEVEIVGDTRGLVEDRRPTAEKQRMGVGASREGEDTGAVREKEGMGLPWPSPNVHRVGIPERSFLEPDTRPTDASVYASAATSR